MKDRFGWGWIGCLARLYNTERCLLGVRFRPAHFHVHYGPYAGQRCAGVRSMSRTTAPSAPAGRRRT